VGKIVIHPHANFVEQGLMGRGLLGGERDRGSRAYR
jgi:hypothetical protein